MLREISSLALSIEWQSREPFKKTEKRFRLVKKYSVARCFIFYPPFMFSFQFRFLSRATAVFILLAHVIFMAHPAVADTGVDAFSGISVEAGEAHSVPVDGSVDSFNIIKQVSDEPSAHSVFSSGEGEPEEIVLDLPPVEFVDLTSETASELQSFSFDYVPNELIVKFKKGVGQTEELTEFSAQNHLQNHGFFAPEGAALLEVRKGRSVDQTILQLKQNPQVEYAEPNYIRELYALPSNDPLKNDLWAVENTGQTIQGIAGKPDADMDLSEAWQITEGDPQVVVAVIDSGVAYRHPDLKNQLWDGQLCVDEKGRPLNSCVHGYDFKGNDKDPLPTFEAGGKTAHGSHIAGIIAAEKDNQKGLMGVAPKVKIMALKTNLSISSIVKSIDFAIQNRVTIVNASFGSPHFSQAEHDAIKRLGDAGGLLITAAGNGGGDNDQQPNYPCAYDLDNIICVAATDQKDELAAFSNYGSKSVDIAAPGVNIASVYIDPQVTSVTEESFDAALPANYINSGRVIWVKNFNGAMITDNEFPYKDDQPMENSLTSPAFDLSGAQLASMDFGVGCIDEYTPNGEDHLKLEFSTDGIHFEEMNRFHQYKLNAPHGHDPNQLVLHFYQISQDIPQKYLTSGYHFRWRWVTDGDNQVGRGLGCVVDDIKITKYDQVDGSDEKYAYWAGTSIATAQVSGVAGLIKSSDSRLNALQIKQLILNSGDSLPGLSGKILSGKRVNANNALAGSSFHVGFQSDDLLPAQQIEQANDGSGLIKISFRIKEGIAGLPVQLKQFEYSIDDGLNWQAPLGGDQSLSLNAQWQQNGYQTAADYAGPVYSFFWNTIHADIQGLAQAHVPKVKIRFKASGGKKDSPFAVSESFLVDNKPPLLTIDAPVKTAEGPINVKVKLLDEGVLLPQSVAITPQSTAQAGNLHCLSTAPHQLDCSLAVYSSGHLILEALDAFGNKASATAEGFTIQQPVAPVQVPVSGGGGGGESVGGGGGGGFMPLPPEDANDRTSYWPFVIRKPINHPQEFSQPIKLNESMLIKTEEGQMAQLTLEAGQLILRPNPKAGLYMVIPPQTTLLGPKNWTGKIIPPLISSEKRRGSDSIIQPEIFTMVKLGGQTPPLKSSHPAELFIPLDLPDDAGVKILTSSGDDNWLPFAEAVVRDGYVSIQTDQWQYYAVILNDDHSDAISEIEVQAVSPVALKDLNQADFNIKKEAEHEWFIRYKEDHSRLTRAEAAGLIMEALNFPRFVSDPPLFADVPKNHPQRMAIESLYDLYLMKDYEGRFYPDRPLTYAETVKLMIEAMGIEIPLINREIWYADYMDFARKNDLISAEVQPNQWITAQGASELMQNLLSQFKPLF